MKSPVIKYKKILRDGKRLRACGPVCLREIMQSGAPPSSPATYLQTEIKLPAENYIPNIR